MSLPKIQEGVSMWNVAEDGALVEIYKSSNLAASDPRNWVIPNKSANSYRESMTWWGGLDLVFLNLFRTWFHVEIYDSDVFVLLNRITPKKWWTKSQPVVFWRSFFLRNMVCFFFLGRGGLWDKKMKDLK